MPAEAALRIRPELVPELVPAGAPEWHDDPGEQPCAACGANLQLERHREDCPRRAEIFRMNVTGDRRLQRLEDLFQVCTWFAFVAAQRAGGRP